MPDSTLRISSSEIRRREHQRLDALMGYLALLRRPDVLDSVITREKAKEAVRGYYETMDKGVLLDDLAGDGRAGDGQAGENNIFDIDDVVLAEMRRVEPGLYFLICMQRQQYMDARRSLSRIVSRLEMDCNEQKDYVRTLDVGRS